MQESHFRCSRCGMIHEGPPLSYSFDAPIYWEGIPEGERPARGVLGEEQCIIDECHFFLKGVLELPIRDVQDGRFTWLVWVSLSHENFERATSLWETPGRELEPPYFGWLSSRIPGYPDTLNLRTNVHTRPVGTRPLVQLEPTEHPLAVEQREGILKARVEELAALFQHG